MKRIQSERKKKEKKRKTGSVSYCCGRVRLKAKLFLMQRAAEFNEKVDWGWD